MKGVVGIIPARKGSRRVLRKNIRILGNKPLVVWTFEVAKKAETLDRVIVSTDDEEVKRLAEEHGVEVPFFPRPPELCGDIDTGLVLQHCVKFLEDEGYEATATVLLQPTSPFKTSQDINDAVKLFTYLGDFDTVVSLVEVKEHPAWLFRRHAIGGLESYLGFPMKFLSGLIAQDLPKLFVPNGAIYVVKKQLALAGRVYGEKLGGYIMPRIRSLDLETEEDFIYAEALIKALIEGMER